MNQDFARSVVYKNHSRTPAGIPQDATVRVITLQENSTMSHQSIVMPGAVLGVGTSSIARERTARSCSLTHSSSKQAEGRPGRVGCGWMDGWRELVLAFGLVCAFVSCCVCCRRRYAVVGGLRFWQTL